LLQILRHVCRRSTKAGNPAEETGGWLCGWLGWLQMGGRGIATMLEDCKQGSETQASLVLARLHAAACGSGRMPEKLYIGADNTPKETKNTTFVVFLVWLLCCMGRKTSLHEVQLESPILWWFSRVMVS